MAELSLKIKADFEEASRQFKALASESEETRAKIEKFTEGFSEKQIDKFTDRQKLAAAAVTATKGNIAGLEAQHKAYGREIEKLIKSGLDPESESIKKLRAEYINLGNALDKAKEKKKLAADGIKMVEKAAMAGVAALVALGAATAAAMVKTAEAGDKYAKTARVIGMTAEQFQELEYAANSSGVSSDTLKGSLEKLNKSMGDIRDGSGALTKHLKESNPALLEQVKNAKNSEQAFMLLMNAIKQAPNEFDRAALATAAFGKSGQELILMADAGATGISDLREEARKYGIISNESAAASEDFVTAQDRLKASLTGARNEMVAGIMPSATKVINKIADFIANIDNLEEKLKTFGIILAGVTVAITTFLVIGKATVILNTMAHAFRALTAAMASNPFGMIAVAITVVITALVLLYKNWDMVQTYLQQGLEKIKASFTFLSAVIKGGLVAAVEIAKAALFTLVDAIYGNVIRGVGKLLEVMGKLPFVGEQFRAASEAVQGFGNAIGASAQEARAAAVAAARDAANITAAQKAELDERLGIIDAEARARREALRQRQQEDERERTEASANMAAMLAELEAGEDKKSIIIEGSLRERLALIADTEAQAEEERLAVFKQFLQARLEAEKLNGEERIAYLNEQQQLIIDSMEMHENEKASLKASIEEMITAEEEKQSAIRVAIKRAEFNAIAGLFGDLADLVEAYGGQNRAAAIAIRALSAAQAGINSLLAFTQTLADPTIPSSTVRTIKAIAIMASGFAAQGKIWTTQIPSAETGGRFIVPNTTPRVDGSYMRVNANEKVNVTPAGANESGSAFNFKFLFNETEFATIINKLARAGELNTLQLAANL